MFRHVLLALTVTLLTGMVAKADSIGTGTAAAPNGFVYSDSALPFEAFEWTALDLAAFAAYGGDFANVRRPVTPVFFLLDDPLAVATVGPHEQGADDEQPELRALAARGSFDPVPEGPAYDVSLAAADDADVPEPGALLLVGLGLLGASRRLRRVYAER